ncbi:MAG: hypothetical protein HC767_00825 [Akkermansiaceae bacterium]|nr:hypothetical protein [Akkermansiaceae bacterium]
MYEDEFDYYDDHEATHRSKLAALPVIPSLTAPGSLSLADEVTIVTAPQELMDAVMAMNRNIEIRAHLDLTYVRHSVASFPQKLMFGNLPHPWKIKVRGVPSGSTH